MGLAQLAQVSRSGAALNLDPSASRAIRDVPKLLRAHDLKPRKGLGQNFLVDPAVLKRIVDAADLSRDDIVVDVGAGVGTLTRLLAEQASRVLAVELDDNLAAILRDETARLPNVQIIHGDILRLSDLDLCHLGYKVVANLPYYITSAVLRHFLSRAPRPRLMVLTIQREVAERIVAAPGQMSLLAVSVQLYGQPRIVCRVGAGSFYPPPSVESAVVRIEVSEQLAVALAEGVGEDLFFRVARAGFAQKRKTLRNALSAGLRLPPPVVEEALGQAGVDPRRRAQTLSLPEWADVAARLAGDLG